MDSRLNAQNAIDSYFVYVLKMEYGWNFWLKLSFGIVINTTKIFFKSLLAQKRSFLLLNLTQILIFMKLSNGSENSFAHGRISKKNLYGIYNYICYMKLYAKNSIFHFDRVNEVWISGILYVKLHSTCFLVHSISPDPF